MPHHFTTKTPKHMHPPRRPSTPYPFSSSTIVTPPSTMRSLPGSIPFVPYTMPSQYTRPALPHPYLDVSAVTWDMRDHQSTVSHKHHPVSRRTLYEPATYPTLPFLHITSHHLPWSIEVYASNNSFVTVGDVLSSVYHSLRTNITSSDFNTLLSPNNQRRATRAYEDRYRRQRSVRIYEEQKRGGMKRIDFLMGHTQFLGISNSGRRPEEWQLLT